MKKITVTIKPYAHCSSVCCHNNSLILSCYSGPECTNDQRVHLLHFNDNVMINHIKLPYLSGNSILYSFKSQIYLIYSMFEKFSRPSVERWKDCSNYLMKIRMPEFETTKPILIKQLEKCLVRAPPITIGDILLLPAYRERNPIGMVLNSSNGAFWKLRGAIEDNKYYTYCSTYGTGVLIQPTIWYGNSVLNSLSRDVTYYKRAWFASSYDFGKTWVKPTPSEIYNDNNSLVVIPLEKPLIVWNYGPGRFKLLLGRLEGLKAIPIIQLNTEVSGSYPNYCFDDFGNLYISFTNGKKIAILKFSKEELSNIDRGVIEEQSTDINVQ